ncbi:MAG: hypothetical protein IK102_11730 [Treponema sp.]|nr:hypothetical protein [Treponema sp.]
MESSGTRRLHSFKEYKSIKTYLFLVFYPRTFIPFIKCVHTALHKFFFLQFSVKLKLRKIPVVSVDNALDKKIPFTPERVSTYLDFIHSLARPMGFCISTFKGKERIRIVSSVLDLLRTCYETASHIYSFSMSTTDRPKYKKDRHFRLIHALDPHLMCVPSLHVAIMIMAWIHYREIFKMPYFTEEESKHYTAQVFESAKAITETVLYVKQHSVNCIPAAIYMMTVILKDLFTIEDAVSFMDCLFVESTDLSPEVKKEINTYIHTMFERFLLEGSSAEDWTDPIKHWLSEYKAS